MNPSQLVAIAEALAKAVRAAGHGWQTGRVWQAHARTRVYCARGAKEMGWIEIDDDGAANCGELNRATEVAPALEAAATALGIQVYGY